MIVNERVIFRVLYDLALHTTGVIKRQGQVFKIAAAITNKRGHILTTGVNQIKTHPIMRQCQFYQDRDQINLHAESDAIRKALKVLGPDLSSYRIHVLRLKRNPTGKTWWMLGNARPCEGCRKLIDKFGIQEIFWTQDCEMDEIWNYESNNSAHGVPKLNSILHQ